MLLSIITINLNNAEGLRKTLDSVASQTCLGFEHIIVDGASTDGSVELVRDYERKASYPVIWSSEPDKGIYEAINKGIRSAKGRYIQVLNSGDTLAANDVVERMAKALEQNDYPYIIYGNMLKVLPNGKKHLDNCGGPGATNSFLYFYKSTLNHNCAYIKRELFDRFGYYDESMKICADWAWYIEVIVKGNTPAIYTDITVTTFDMTGISETNMAIREQERKDYLTKNFPTTILSDYECFSFPIEQYVRLKRHHLWPIVWFVERVLFKLEKWNIIK